MTSHEILNMIDNLKDRIKDKEYKELVEKIAELNKKEENYVSFKILKITESKQISQGCRNHEDEWESNAATLFESNNYEHLVMNFKIVDNDNNDDRIFSMNMIERGYDISKAQYEKLKRDISMNGCQVLRKWSHVEHNNEYRLDWENDEQYSFFNTTYIITGIVEE